MIEFIIKNLHIEHDADCATVTSTAATGRLINQSYNNKIFNSFVKIDSSSNKLVVIVHGSMSSIEVFNIYSLIALIII